MQIRNFRLFKNSVENSVDKRVERVIVRADLNLPSDTEDLSRIHSVKETIAEILGLGLNVIIISHYKRPKKEEYFSDKFSLGNVKDKVAQVMGIDVDFVSTSIHELSADMLKSKLTILENLRFYEGEETNDHVFAKQLASLGDCYINEAFSVSHRKHASVCSITEFLPSFAGISFEREIEALSKVTDNIKRPYTAIIGGAKVSSKIDVLEKISKVADNLAIAGMMANTFLVAIGRSPDVNAGAQLGKSRYEKDCIDIARNIYRNSSAKIILPVDFMCSPDINENGLIFSNDAIPSNYSCFDIGTNTIESIKKIIDGSMTVLWSGALGAFEFANFNISSNEIGKFIAEKTTNDKDFTSLIGGGETIASIKEHKDQMSFASTAGGAFLEYIAGCNLPGVSALKI